MRMGWEFEGENPEVAYYCGMLEMIREYTLNRQEVTGDLTLNIDSDLFYLGEDGEIPLPEAMSKRVKHYSGVGTYDKQGNFIPYDRFDDFDFKLIKQPDDTDPEDAIYDFLIRISCDGKMQPLPQSSREQINAYLLSVRTYFAEPDGVYKADGDLCKQLTKSQHYQYMVFSVLFLKFGSFMVMLTEGTDE